MRFHWAGHALAFLTAAVILPFQIPRILDHREWVRGTARTMGMIDKMIIGRRITEVRYSYEVNGKHYNGEDTGAVFVEGTPEWVTYAKSDPSVSTLLPNEVGQIYVTSCIMAVIGVIPMTVLWWLELASWAKARRARSG